MPELVDLQALNGAEMHGRVLQTDVSCAAVTVHIAAEMRRRLCEDIVKQEKKISILIDESTTVSRLFVLTSVFI